LFPAPAAVQEFGFLSALRPFAAAIPVLRCLLAVFLYTFYTEITLKTFSAAKASNFSSLAKMTCTVNMRTGVTDKKIKICRV
jgi:hypothetical protein